MQSQGRESSRASFFDKDSTGTMDDLNKVLQEGDMVYLDYMVGDSGTRGQTHSDLVWQGSRPKEVRQMSPDEFLQRLQIDTQDGENLPGFQDFHTEIEQAEKTSRGPPRVPSNTELRERTLPSKGKGKSSSVSVAGVSAAQSTVTSTRTHMLYPGDYNESSIFESTADSSFLSAGVADEEVLRLAKMVVAEVIAEKERLRAALRNVGVQTR